MPAPASPPAPAVLKIAYRVLPEEREGFERTLQEMVKAAETSPGRLGVDVLRPVGTLEDAAEWLVILRYRTEADLCAWRGSTTARTTRARLDAMTVGAPRVERVHGLEPWFAMPDRRDVSPPPKWKMALVSIGAIYPLIMLVQPLVAPFVRQLPKALAVLIEMAAITPLMTWLMLPLLIWLFKGWLYSGGKSRASPPKPAHDPTDDLPVTSI